MVLPALDDGVAHQLLGLPNELLLAILGLCTVDSLLHLLLVCEVASYLRSLIRLFANQTNKRLHRLATEILDRYIKLLDNHGLKFLPHQAGVDQTVGELEETLETAS